jgi:ribosomal protein S18 acetylase RimI-like enzyme
MTIIDHSDGSDPDRIDKSAPMTIRHISGEDLKQVLAIQVDVYPPGLQENFATFEDKFSLRPAGIFGAFLEDVLCGYILSHPWSAGRIVPLGLARTVLPGKADCVYIHDLAVRPSFRGRGAARRLVDRVFEFGGSLSLGTYTLMAVQASEPFWSRFGFRVLKTIEYVPGIMGSEMMLERPVS